ncbi:hypothetical protein LPLAFNJD_LOCUS969 [Methylorubrum aminovorans]
MLDASHVKAHRSASCGKRGAWIQAIGRSRGGFTSKIHCLADGRGRPVAFALTPGNVAGISMALPLLQTVVPPKRLIADNAYDAQSLRDWLKSRKVIATIPSTATRTVPYKHSRIAYRRRNRNERLFGRLKNWRLWRTAEQAAGKPLSPSRPYTLWFGEAAPAL